MKSAVHSQRWTFSLLIAAIAAGLNVATADGQSATPFVEGSRSLHSVTDSSFETASKGRTDLLLFEDDFESGDLSKWDMIDNATITTEQVHQGNYAAKIGDFVNDGELIKNIALDDLANGISFYLYLTPGQQLTFSAERDCMHSVVTLNFIGGYVKWYRCSDLFNCQWFGEANYPLNTWFEVRIDLNPMLSYNLYIAGDLVASGLQMYEEEADYIMFRAYDYGGAYLDDVEVLANEENTPVVFDIPNQTIAEGGAFATINLDDYVRDDDNPDDQLTWTYNGNVNLQVDITNRVATITTPNNDWNGAETITFRATDPSGAWDEDPATFTVTAINDAPIVSDIPSQTIDEGYIFATINLDDYVDDPDNPDDEITWTYSGNTQLIVDITDRLATIITPGVGWIGAETVTFRATDPNDVWDEDPATFTVMAVNDAPVLSDIPDQTIDEGGTFATISLDDYVDDVDNPDDQMTWTCSGNSELLVDITDRVATITTPHGNWHGAETITFRAIDPGGAWDEDPATFTVTAVNDAPVLFDIPDQTIDEGGTFATISLDDYVADVDNPDDQMTWTCSGNSELHVDITGRVATITTPHDDWNGAETITFQATDPGGAWDENAATFTVTAINDAPVLSDIPDQTIDEGGTFATISLDEYVDDVDHPDGQMTWTCTGDVELLANITDRVATITSPHDDWNGTETITFRATDPGGSWDEDPATFTVTAVNDAPVLSDIPDQTINEGGTFPTIILDDYADDIDNTDDELTWTSSGNVNLQVNITGRVATVTVPDDDWSGTETITFRVTDPGSLWDEAPATFTVTAVNDAPVVAGIPDQVIGKGGSFATINLDNYVDDVDNTDDQMTWTYNGNDSLQVNIASRVATVTALNADWCGTETITFRATDPGSLWNEDPATFEVLPDAGSPDAPSITGRSNGAPLHQYIHTFSSTDAEGDNVRYKINWGDGCSEEWSDLQPSGQNYTATHYWNTCGNYTIAAKAKDVLGNVSCWNYHSLSLKCPNNGGGCPHVAVRNGNSFIRDNNILPQSEELGNLQDVTDFYRLRVPPEPSLGRYHIRLEEFENEHTYVDRMELAYVDHTPGLYLGVTDHGKLCTHSKLMRPQTISSSFDRDLCGLAPGTDDSVVTLHAGETIIVNFGPVPCCNGARLVANMSVVGREDVQLANWGSGHKSASGGTTKGSAGVQSGYFKPVPGVSGTVSETAVLRPRENGVVAVADVSHLLPPEGEDVVLTFTFPASHWVDFIGLDTSRQLPLEMTTLNLVSATHSKRGDVTEALTSVDQDYAELLPGEHMDIVFDAVAPVEGMERDFILISTGHYYTIGSASTEQTREIAPSNFPNPFNPTTTIEFTLPEASDWTVTIYNVLGQRVALFDGRSDAGKVSVTWDASRHATGVYFYRIEAGGLTASKKMLLIK